MSWDALAKKLGVSRQAVVLWRKLDGAPESRDVPSWEAFVAKNGLNVNGQGKPTDMRQLKEEKLVLDIALTQAKLNRENRKVIERDEVNRLLVHIGAEFRTNLYQFLETEAPPKLDGMSSAQMRPILREMADAILARAADTIARFNNQ